MIKCMLGFDVNKSIIDNPSDNCQKNSILYTDGEIFGKFLLFSKDSISTKNPAEGDFNENTQKKSDGVPYNIIDYTRPEESGKYIEFIINFLPRYDATMPAGDNKLGLEDESFSHQSIAPLLKPIKNNNFSDKKNPENSDYCDSSLKTGITSSVHDSRLTIEKKRSPHLSRVEQVSMIERPNSVSTKFVEGNNELKNLEKTGNIEISRVQSNFSTDDLEVSHLNFHYVGALEKFASSVAKHAHVFDKSNIGLGQLAAGHITELRLASHSNALLVRMDVPELGKIIARFGGSTDTISMTLTSKDETGAQSVAAMQREMNLWLDQLNVDALESIQLANYNSDNSDGSQKGFPTSDNGENRRPVVTMGDAVKLDETQIVSVERRPESENENSGKWRLI